MVSWNAARLRSVRHASEIAAFYASMEPLSYDVERDPLGLE